MHLTKITIEKIADDSLKHAGLISKDDYKYIKDSE